MGKEAIADTSEKGSEQPWLLGIQEGITLVVGSANYQLTTT